MIAISFASCWPCSCPGWGMFFIFSGHRLELTLTESARYANSFTRSRRSRRDNGCPVWAADRCFPLGDCHRAQGWKRRFGKINAEICSAGGRLPAPSSSSGGSDRAPLSPKANRSTGQGAFSGPRLTSGSRKFLHWTDVSLQSCVPRPAFPPAERGADQPSPKPLIKIVVKSSTKIITIKKSIATYSNKVFRSIPLTRKTAFSVSQSAHMQDAELSLPCRSPVAVRSSELHREGLCERQCSSPTLLRKTQLRMLPH